MHVRICRAKNLTPEDRDRVVAFMVASLGKRYDLKNVTDLLRFFMPTPPVPVRFRRRMLAMGAGDPTRAICSSLIAEAFEPVRYPILPRITRELRHEDAAQFQRREILHIRHHSLYAPRDFDISPYFQIVKPTLEAGFDYRRLHWSDAATRGRPAVTGVDSARSEAYVTGSGRAIRRTHVCHVKLAEPESSSDRHSAPKLDRIWRGRT